MCISSDEESVPRTDSEAEHTVAEIKKAGNKRIFRRHRNKKSLPSIGRTSSPVAESDVVSQSMLIVPRSSPASSGEDSHSDQSFTVQADLSFDDAWYLTPPPIFTSVAPFEIEISPQENQFIEHPRYVTFF